MRIFLIITLFCLNTVTVYSQSNLSLVNLDSVKVETDDHASLVDIKLSAKPDWNRIELEDHGSFLQLSLPNVTVPKPGEFVQGKGPIFPKIGLLQPKNNLSSIRLFANTEAAKIKNNSTVDVLDNRIIVRTEHKGLVGESSEINKPADQSITPLENVSAAEKTENTKEESYIDAFKKIKSGLGVESNPQTANTENKAAENVNSMDELLQEKLKIAAVVSAVLFLIMIGIRFVLPRIRAFKNQNLKIPAQEKNSKTIEILSTTSINAKNKLQVIKIGHQNFLLNIGLDQVQLLTELDNGQSRLSEANPMLAASAGVQSRESIKLKASGNTTVALPARKEETGSTMLSRVVNGATSSSVKPAIQSQEQAFERAKAIANNLKAQNQKPSATAGKRSLNKTSRINVAIGDEGVVQRNSGSNANQADAAKDVTRLIREKLSKLKDLET